MMILILPTISNPVTAGNDGHITVTTQKETAFTEAMVSILNNKINAVELPPEIWPHVLDFSCIWNNRKAWT